MEVLVLAGFVDQLATAQQGLQKMNSGQTQMASRAEQEGNVGRLQSSLTRKWRIQRDKMKDADGQQSEEG